MADGVFNIAKGAAAQLVRDNPDSITVLLLTASLVDGSLVDAPTVQALLAEGGNTEATFTNYSRKTGVVPTLVVNNTTNVAGIDLPDQVWVSAGGAVDETVVKLIVAVSTGAGDGNLIPLTHHDFAVTTDGTDITATIHADGIYSAI